MAIVLFTNLKGGVAKTTNTVAVAEAMAEAGKKILVIDADHQCTAGELLLGRQRLMVCERRKATLHDLLARMLDSSFDAGQIESYIERGASDIKGGMDNLAVLPCSLRIDDFSTNMAKARRGFQTNEEFYALFRKRRKVLAGWLSDHFDYTIVDCPPTIAFQVKVLLTVADAMIVPTIPDRLSVRGSVYLLDRLRRTRIKIHALGTLWSLYRAQNKTHRAIVQSALDKTEPYVDLPLPFKTIIPNATAIARAFEEYSNYTSLSDKYTLQFARLFRLLSAEIEGRLEMAGMGK